MDLVTPPELTGIVHVLQDPLDYVLTSLLLDACQERELRFKLKFATSPAGFYYTPHPRAVITPRGWHDRELRKLFLLIRRAQTRIHTRILLKALFPPVTAGRHDWF